MRVSLPFFTFAQCTLMIDSRSHTAFGRCWLKTESTGKSSRVISMFHCHRLSCVYSMCSFRFPFLCGWCETSSGTGCELVTGQSWNNGLSWTHTDGGRGCYSGNITKGYIVQWLERLTANQQVPGSIPGGGHGFSS